MRVTADPQDVLFVLQDRYGHDESGAFAIAAARLRPEWQLAAVRAPGEKYDIPFHALCVAEPLDNASDDPVVFDAFGIRRLSDILEDQQIRASTPRKYLLPIDEPTAMKLFMYDGAQSPRTLRELQNAITAAQTVLDMVSNAATPAAAAA